MTSERVAETPCSVCGHASIVHFSDGGCTDDDCACTANPDDRIAELRAELDRVTRERDDLKSEVLKYRNAITWETSCVSCSNVLDRSYAETCRREAAEEELDRVRSLAKEWSIVHTMPVRLLTEALSGTSGTPEEPVSNHQHFWHRMTTMGGRTMHACVSCDAAHLPMGVYGEMCDYCNILPGPVSLPDEGEMQIWNPPPRSERTAGVVAAQDDAQTEHVHDWYAVETAMGRTKHLCRGCDASHSPWGRYGQRCDGCGVLGGPDVPAGTEETTA